MTRYTRRPEIEAAPMQDETVLYHPGTRKFCLLNETAAFLWTRLEVPRTAAELTTELVSTFGGVDAGVAERDVDATLRRFVDLEMIAAVPGIN